MRAKQDISFQHSYVRDSRFLADLVKPCSWLLSVLISNVTKGRSLASLLVCNVLTSIPMVKGGTLMIYVL